MNRGNKSLVLVLIIVALAVSLSYSPGRDLFGVRPFLLSAFSPLQFAVGWVWNGAIGVPAFLGGLRHSAEEITKLRKELAEAKAQLLLLDELRIENDRLRFALNFKAAQHYGRRLLAARVIGRSGSPQTSVLGLNQGGAAGVRVNFPVIGRDGLVGRIIEVSPFSSKVLLITDRLSSVAAVDQRSRDNGAVGGRPPGGLTMKYVSSSGDVAEGDRIVTAAISGLFPPGLPIGTVSRATKKEFDLFYEISIKPAVDFSRLEEVFIVL